MIKMNSKYNKQRGSVFFYILLGVVLFGALAFTVSRGMRGKQADTMTDRQAEISASEILDYAQKLGHAVDKLRRNGCSENEISFENPLIGGYINANSPVDKSCHIFEPEGGNHRLNHPPKYGDSWHFIRFLAIPSFGAGGYDGTAILKNINEKLCKTINKELNGWSEIPYSSHGAAFIWRKFDGNFPTGDGNGLSMRFSPSDPVLVGFSSGCFNNINANGGTGEYEFYYLLLVR